VPLGRRRSVTALALSADDRTAFSVAKDGSICQLDIETCKRCAAPAPLQPPSNRRPVSLWQQASYILAPAGAITTTRTWRRASGALRPRAPGTPAAAGAL